MGIAVAVTTHNVNGLGGKMVLTTERGTGGEWDK